jgi:ribosomal protein L7/L12
MNYYAEAIEIITKYRNTADLILIEIAKMNPAAVIKGNDALRARGKNTYWHKDVIPYLKKEQKIKAIKLCREITGMGLREAKEAVENIKF